MEPDWSVELAKCVASHFPEGRAEGVVAHLGFAGLTIACNVPSVQERGGWVSASLYFHVGGEPFGGRHLFASISGYGKTVPEAVITGGCNWTCTLRPLLGAAFLGELVPDDAFERRVTIHGQPVRVIGSGIDRAMGVSELPEHAWKQVRSRYPTHWMSDAVVASGSLPIVDRPTLLSVFVGATANDPIVEVKVSGTDWPAGWPSVDPGRGAFAHGAVLLREIAVLVPEAPAPALTRAAIETTLRGCALPLPEGTRPATTWRGWAAHGGQLGPPLGEAGLRELESILGPLPDDYRVFVRDVAATGAGPGFGLLSPAHPAQRPFATGAFPWEDEAAQRELLPRGVLVLSHAGDGVTWLLVLNGPRRGEVWVDASGSDGHVGPVAPSFSAWYRDWLASVVHNGAPFVQWDARACASAGVLSQVLRKLEDEDGLSGEAVQAALVDMLGPGSLSLTSSGSNAFDQAEPVDPCEGCVAMGAGLGLSEAIWAAGAAPLQARAAAPLQQPWWKRWFG